MSPLISGLASVASLLFNAASGASKSGASRRGSDGDEAQPSAVVTLSAEAEALAGVAGKGVLVSQRSGDGKLAASAGTGSVSAQDFQELLTQFGADDVQKAQLTAGFDADKDGRISHDEFVKGLASTAPGKPRTDFGQAVLQVMDRAGNTDGVVNTTEFAALTTAFAHAERRAA